ncbi:MAG: bile acid:sodium symporter family protein [Bacteroidales bacterium]|nr:bile acid:sodium symporter family protein [Bacteroidales bacterium]MDT8432101.1 bile acid:sodium symporter family protein [Bacteroidales bacterium]
MIDALQSLQDTIVSADTTIITEKVSGMLATFREMDKERLNFGGASLPLQIVLGVVMFGVALGIKTQHFKDVAKNPRLVILGFSSQFILLPAVTFLLVLLLNRWITPTVALGMILVASCPGGNISNFMSSVAKANVALSVTLTAIATLGAIVLTPFNFAFWGEMYLKFAPSEATAFLRELHIDPIEMFKTVFILLGVPLLLGMWFNHKFPKLTAKIFNPFKNISMVIFLLLVVVLFGMNYNFFIRFIGYIFIVVLLHNIVALGTGYSLGSVFKTDVPTRRTFAIETGIQNSGLGLVLLFNEAIFPTELKIGGMAFIAGWWGIWHILSGLGIANIWARVPYDDRFRLKYFRPKFLKKG